MSDHLLIDISKGEFRYELFYTMAFLAAYLILIFEGIRRKFPFFRWIILLALIRFFVVIGTKIFSYSIQDWIVMFQNHSFLYNNEKTMFGGLILGVAGYFLGRYLLKFKYPVWDTIAIAFPVAVAIQSIGCFFYGCCFGTPSNLPWAVQYPVMSLAHYHQFGSGLITLNDVFSLPVHPVQIYETAGGFLVVFLVLFLRKLFRAHGSLVLCSAIVFSLVRFSVEFFRDPLSNKTGEEMLWIMKQVQWQYLVFAILMSIVLFFRERNYQVKIQSIKCDQSVFATQVSIVLSLSFILLILRNWFTLPEVIALNIALLPAVIYMGVELYKRYSSYRYRWVYVCSLFLPLFLMSQTLPQTQIDEGKFKNQRTWHTIGTGIATGNYTDYRYNYSGGGCDIVSNDEYFSQKYTVAGAGYSYTKNDPARQVTTRFGANIVAGGYSQLRQSDNYESRRTLVDINPFVKYDTRWVGMGAGLHIGNMVFTTGDRRKKYDSNPPVPLEGNFHTFIMPQFDLRIGVKRFFFADFHLADQFPTPVPGLAFQTGIGSGFGLKNGLNLRAGLSFLETSSFYISGYFPIADQIVIEPLFLWTGKNERTSYTVKLPEKQFSFGISYRFGYK
ncbi:MAG: hypothetical protein GYA41_03110 [Bacteroidales bacterium]|nr:hypothetical protein [Bacteroidales bacterium]